MRQRSVVGFARPLGAAGVGSLLGVATAGVVAVMTGEAFRAGSPWLNGLPVLCVLGACVGLLTSWTTRRWLLPDNPWRPVRTRRRMLLFTLAGMLVVPLAVAAGQLAAVEELTPPLMLIGSAATLMLWMQAPPHG